MRYIIKSGDILSVVAQRYNVSVAQILAANPQITNANNIIVGQRMIIPSGEFSQITYKIRRGDYLDKVARKYKTSIAKILRANPKIKNANRIRVGQRIIIPASRTVTAEKELLTLKWLYEPTNPNVEITPYESTTHDKITVEEIVGKSETLITKEVKKAVKEIVDEALITKEVKKAVKEIVDNEGTLITEELEITVEEVVDETGTLITEEVEITTEEQFNRKKFFSAFRDTFGSLNQKQVDGLGSLLTSFEKDQKISNLKYMAYMLATIKHETANKFLPITEYGGRSYFNKYDPVLANTSRRRARAKRNGNTSRGDGFKYRGRGFVQITWKNNYKKLGNALGVDLVNHPEKSLDPVIAYKIMSYGMRNGTFTGRRLSSYISKNRADYKNARKIINGLDKATLIKSYAQKFERILRKAAN